MRPLALLLLPLTLGLAACGPRGVQAPEAYDVSGTVSGDWGTGPMLRLALVGSGFPSVVTNESGRAQTPFPANGNPWTFGFDLPNIPGVFGVYQIVAYNDANNNAQYDIGESFARNSQWLVYSSVGGNVPATQVTPELNVEQGWNVYDRRAGTLRPGPPSEKITGYDISR
ncbi:hypothetical protein [Deinococcus planocerae]|uniref:hypothetical protein n=1 Tax=Deinococcus planocerae TaxID=1737569 RepID=UPI000C7EAE6B|nr:hypothetical protein [Deinococcus planocerae]